MNIKKSPLLILVFLFSLCFTLSCAKEAPTPKNIILLIGDGMGINILTIYNDYCERMEDSRIVCAIKEVMDQGTNALTTTYPAQYLVTDSSAAGTAMACGFKTLPRMIGMKPDLTTGPSILDVMEDNGLSTGLISNTRMTHATPAAFYAHTESRYNDSEIADQLIERNDIEVLFSAGINSFIPQHTTPFELEGTVNMDADLLEGESKRQDDRNLIQEASDNGYKLIFTLQQLNQMDKDIDKVLGLFANKHFPYYIDRKRNTSLPTLSQMTEKALEILSQNQNGFFLMVEGGLIDWTTHANDPAATLYEMIEFDQTVQTALNFAYDHKDTLVLVTADHSTGGWGLSYTGDRQGNMNFIDPSIYDILIQQEYSLAELVRRCTQREIEEDKIYQYDLSCMAYNLMSSYPVHISQEELSQQLGCDETSICHLDEIEIAEYTPFYPYVDELPSVILSRMIAENLGMVWNTGTHTSDYVLTTAFGPGMHLFNGIIDNTDIFNFCTGFFQSLEE